VLLASLVLSSRQATYGSVRRSTSAIGWYADA